ncbi:CDP-alcohol phosphatidyltransferase family protein [Microbacterium jejuense]|uniref:CDP-alcohol phosphatidyltransferase family protein n=1 Tax=Microbacterium jejuense TaxID=1263637 RepID=A0ABS7HJ79_9MICO|nr:CDP-alcohol phosphatidyltransferase family protein [Microbacterium jejuense]MBW9092351.1 CDP-alcohol phosphatidyltransferase family protein [Microbacterium jejuense]
MPKVQPFPQPPAAWSRPWWWAAAGFAMLVVVGLVAPLTPLAWAGGVAYLVVSTTLLSLGLRRRGTVRFGAANAVTATRSALVGVVTALVVAAFGGGGSTALLVTIAAFALALDGVDGYVARRTASVSELGGRFDMEVDAFLLLVLSIYDARFLGWWVLSIGLMRYAFVAAAWVLPFFARPLPYRYWRKVVTAACGIALAVVASQLLPAVANTVLVGTALALLVESFGRDVLWLVRMNRTGPRLVSPENAPAHDPGRARDESR